MYVCHISKLLKIKQIYNVQLYKHIMYSTTL